MIAPGGSLEGLELFASTLRAEWKRRAIEFVEEHVRVKGEVDPDDLSDWTMESRHNEPPSSACLGSLWNELRLLGLVRTTTERKSRIKSNNARKVRVWVPGPKWGSESTS